MTEAQYQKRLKERLKERFPGCIVLKTDPQQLQGIPDLIIFNEDKWAALEVKVTEKASHRPNQDYRVEQMNAMSFAAFVFPENEEEILDAMARLFQA